MDQLHFKQESILNQYIKRTTNFTWQFIFSVISSSHVIYDAYSDNKSLKPDDSFLSLYVQIMMCGAKIKTVEGDRERKLKLETEKQR